MQPPPSAPAPGYGPRPAGPEARPLTRAQGRVLEVLKAQERPVSLAGLADLTGLHPNTLRDHLEALTGVGLVRRRRQDPAGPGRPAWGYEADSGGLVAGHAEYAGLATALAAAIHRTSQAPQADAAAAGDEWGRELARGHGHPGRAGAAAARREVVALFDEIGFAPEADGRASDVRLTRCPLLDAALRYPDVVCAVHLGIARGALDEYGADSGPVELRPFAEPGACRLHLGGRQGGRRGGSAPA